MITIPGWISTIANVLVLGFGVIYLALSPITWKERSTFILDLFAMGLVAIFTSVLVSVLLTIYSPMSWYANPRVGIMVFVFPAAFGYIIALMQFLPNEVCVFVIFFSLLNFFIYI